VSKAFTSEETPDVGPVTRPPPRLAPGEVRYVTPEGHARLRTELAWLGDERDRAAALPEAERAARRAELDRRAVLVEATLAAVTVLGPEATPDGIVGFGTWVTVEDEDGGRIRWRLVGADEADPRQGLVSVHAPVARALLGRGRGDVVEAARPGGTRALTIVDVSRSR
jgi:transcription elongation factor GreB